MEPGFKKVLIKPYLPESMNHMECKYESVNGPIYVSMQRQDDRIKLDVQVSENISVKIDRANLREQEKVN